jgi:hypothetical protein
VRRASGKVIEVKGESRTRDEANSRVWLRAMQLNTNLNRTSSTRSVHRRIRTITARNNMSRTLSLRYASRSHYLARKAPSITTQHDRGRSRSGQGAFFCAAKRFWLRRSQGITDRCHIHYHTGFWLHSIANGVWRRLVSALIISIGGEGSSRLGWLAGWLA